MVIVICIISVLPWIGLGDFSTKGEPREAAVAVSMLETGNWVLPQVYANEFAYKPPLAPLPCRRDMFQSSPPACRLRWLLLY